MTSAATPQRRPRRHDPDRRLNIARAAVALLAEQGLFALSHRAVAEQADVPLGSTTYHFADLDDLLAAALELIALDEVAALERWAEAWDLSTELIPALVDLVDMSIVVRHDLTMIEYEMHVAAFRRPRLREVSLAWDEKLTGLLAEHLTERQISHTIALLDGLLLAHLARDMTPDHEIIRSGFELMLR